jgi:hypothetical protein
MASGNTELVGGRKKKKKKTGNLLRNGSGKSEEAEESNI